MSTINSKWLQDIDQNDLEAKERRTDLVKNSIVLDVLSDIIQSELTRLSRCPEVDYNNPNWAFHEADRNGQYRALQAILSLTTRKIK